MKEKHTKKKRMEAVFFGRVKGKKDPTVGGEVDEHVRQFPVTDLVAAMV
jgi:hypothetical protein